MGNKMCFVIMSFKSDYDLVYQAAIRKAVEELGFECVRVDDDPLPKNIPTKIVQNIIESDLVIADITESSPNVYYELGISHTIGNKTIIISQNLRNLPFDTRNEYTIEYSNDRNGIQLLYFELREIILSMLAHPNEPSNIVQIVGRDYFDFRRKIIENLEQLNKELKRAQAFQKYLSNGRRTDNDKIVEYLAKKILEVHRNSVGPTLIGISGAAGLGKTTLSLEVVDKIKQIDSDLKAETLPFDSFMMDRAERLSKNLSGYNPDSNDLEKTKNSISSLINGNSVRYNPYDHFTGKHQEEKREMGPADIVILDGIHSFHPCILSYLKYKIFLYATPPDGKELRFLTDLFERNYTVNKAFQHAEEEYENFEKYILHYIRFADEIVLIDNYWKYKT